MKNMNLIKGLIGNVMESDLEQVDCAVSRKIGVFVPSTGYCKYAIRPNHTHPSYMINIFVVGGQTFIQPEIEVPEHHYFATLVSPDVPHTEDADGEFHRYYAVMIDKICFEEIYKKYFNHNVKRYEWFQFCVNQEIIFYLKQFMFEYETLEERGENCRQQVLDALSDVIIHKLIRNIRYRSGEKKPELEAYGIQKAEQFMQQRYGSGLTLECLADVANMSVSHFDRQFRKEYQCSPHQYLLRIRIEKAKKELKMPHRLITEIAFRCGFSSAAYFAACFRKSERVSPSEYRKSFQIKK